MCCAHLTSTAIGPLINSPARATVNSWNLFNCRVNATILKGIAQAMHDTGLQAAGYEYVNSDDVRACALK